MTCPNLIWSNGCIRTCFNEHFFDPANVNNWRKLLAVQSLLVTPFTVRSRAVARLKTHLGCVECAMNAGKKCNFTAVDMNSTHDGCQFFIRRIQDLTMCSLFPILQFCETNHQSYIHCTSKNQHSHHVSEKCIPVAHNHDGLVVVAKQDGIAYLFGDRFDHCSGEKPLLK